MTVRRRGETLRRREKKRDAGECEGEVEAEEETEGGRG